MQYRVVAADAFSTQRQHLWDLCYRVTGSVADADMLLRECFAKAVERPLIEREADWRPHLIRSAAMLAVDALRHRRRRNYVGSWLPSPIETGNAASPGPRTLVVSVPQYDMVESGSMAFLRTLETLDPRERLLFALCDVFSFVPQDAAMLLDLTTATAKILLSASRRKMQDYASTQVPPTGSVQAEVTDRLRDCLSHIQRFDATELEAMLAPNAQAVFDSAGEFVAPPGIVFEAATIAKMLLKFAEGIGPTRFSFRMLNGLPAALGQSKGRPRWAKRFVFRVEVHDGLISEVQVIMATAKLTAVRFDPL